MNRIHLLLSLMMAGRQHEAQRLKMMAFSSPIFEPKKHTKLSYSAQNRAAKKRRNNKQVR